MIEFGDPSPGDGGYCGSTAGSSCFLLPTSITSPDGKLVTINYEFFSRCIQNSSNDALDADLGYDGQDFILEGLSASRTRRYARGPGIDEPLVAYLVTSTGTSRLWCRRTYSDAFDIATGVGFAGPIAVIGAVETAGAVGTVAVATPSERGAVPRDCILKMQGGISVHVLQPDP